MRHGRDVLCCRDSLKEYASYLLSWVYSRVLMCEEVYERMRRGLKSEYRKGCFIVGESEHLAQQLDVVAVARQWRGDVPLYL